MSRRIPLLHLASLVVVALTSCSPVLLSTVPTVRHAVSSDSVSGGPAGAPSTADEAKQALSKAEALRRIGEREKALATLQPLLEHPDAAIAAEATYRTALLRLELGFSKEAAGVLENLLARFPQASNVDRATFLLGVARRQADDCGGAIAALSQYASRASLLAPYAALQLATCYQTLGDTAAALARAEDVLQQTDSRRLQIEALERQAGILAKAGDQAGAVARYEQIVDLAREPNYKADIRLAAGGLNVELGRTARAVAHLVAIVNELPAARSAAAALDRLVGLQAQDQVSFFQAGMVRYFARDYPAAMRNFDGALATPSETANQAAAAFYRAVSRVRQGAELEGSQDLLGLPGAYQGSRYAPMALLRGGKVLESNGRFDDALQAYRRVARDYPASDEAKEGLYRLGLASMLRGATGDAVSAWGQLGATDAQADLRSLGLLWQGKLEASAGDIGAARTHWQQAVDVGNTWYGGLRALGLLDPSNDALTRSVRTDLARLEISPDELAGLDAWTATNGSSLTALAAEQAGNPSLARADELLALGLKAEAGWELDDQAIRYDGDPARLAGLALSLHQRGLDTISLKQTQQAMDAAHIGSRQAPAALQKMLFPLPYPEMFIAQGEHYGIDPLLLASLVRQESMFDPEAKSSANAVGLTQVVPGTAREIAGALDRSGFQLDDLTKPAVSLEFGAFYFGQRMKRFNGAIFPALAAYNAGDSPVDAWVRDYGLGDIDLFAERIPYAETNHYVKVIFENYGIYRALYSAR